MANAIRPYSDSEATKLLNDVFDPDRVVMHCETHSYYGPMKRPGFVDAGPMPAKGCKKCWFVFLFNQIATTPPHERQAKLEEMEMVIRKTSELADKGQFDFEVFDRPQVQITKEK